MSRTNLLSQAQYARSRKARGLPGGTREAVRKAVETGRIDVFGEDRLIDQDLADDQWRRNTRARFSPQAAAGAPTVVGQLPAETGGYTAARARRETAEAEQAEIELMRTKGELVAASDVKRAGFEIGRDLRDAMESAVSALAAEVAPLSSADDCAAVLRRHHRALCECLVKGWRERLGPLPEEGFRSGHLQG